MTVEVDDGEATAGTQTPETAVVASDSFLSGTGYRQGDVPGGCSRWPPSELKMTATAFDWLVSADERSILQGDAGVDGSDAAWRLRAHIGGPSSFTTATVALWRPGVTTLAAPDYLIGGWLDHGRLVTR